MTRGVVTAIAGEPLRAGTFVELREGKAFADRTLTRTGGVVKNIDGPDFRPGARLSVVTDGGVLTRISVTVTIKVRGHPLTLYADEQYYLRLSGGLPVGFDGDHRLIA